MDIEQFKQHLQELSLSYAQFAEIIGTSASNVKMCLKRGNIPKAWEEAVTKRLQNQLVTGHEAVTTVESHGETVTGHKSPKEIVADNHETRIPKLKVLRSSAEAGHPEWDIMEDGYARGFPGDTNLMRGWYRTPSAYRRIVEAADPDFKQDRITSMQHLPNVFKINREGKPTTVDGQVIKLPANVKTVRK